MARAKTGSFYLTERVTLPAATASGVRVQGTIDLGAYVSVAQGVACAIDSVDFIWQTGDGGGDVQNMVAADAALGAQLTDLNPGTGFVLADSQSLIASGSMCIDQSANIATHTSDIYPDNFGPSKLSEMFLVVNDTLYLNAGVDGNAIGGVDVHLTARIRTRLVSLSKDDWVAIAIQATAADN